MTNGKRLCWKAFWKGISAGGSYFSHSDLRAHFGLWQNASAESVEVIWPSGQRQVFRDVAADRFYVIEEGKDRLAPQKFDAPSGGVK
jgi:hypothetical protein